MDKHASFQNIYIKAGLKITSSLSMESESTEYGACRLSVNGYNVAFRIAKTTPRKIGQFVTIWKRPEFTDKIMPIDITDNIDFVVINVSDEMHFGQFVFDKKILLEKDIFSKNSQGGKRAFRVYPPWVEPLSSQAVKTQKWQSSYFFDFMQEEGINIKQVRKLFKSIMLDSAQP